MNPTSPSALSTERITLVPIGWKRVRDNDRIYYVSPTKDRLWNMSDVVKYVTSDGTCKCNLQCPLFLDQVFSFSVDDKQMEPPFDKSKSKLCNCPIIRRGRPRKYEVKEGVKINYKKKKYQNVQVDTKASVDDHSNVNDHDLIPSNVQRNKNSDSKKVKKKETVIDELLNNNKLGFNNVSNEDNLPGKYNKNSKKRTRSSTDNVRSESDDKKSQSDNYLSLPSDIKSDDFVNRKGKKKMKTAKTSEKSTEVAGSEQQQRKRKKNTNKVTNKIAKDSNIAQSIESIDDNLFDKSKSSKNKRQRKNLIIDAGENVTLSEVMNIPLQQLPTTPINIENQQPSPSFDYNKHLIMPTTANKVTLQSNPVTPRTPTMPNYSNNYFTANSSSSYDVGHPSVQLGNVQQSPSNLLTTQLNNHQSYTGNTNNNCQIGECIEPYRTTPGPSTPIDSHNSYEILHSPTLTKQQLGVPHGATSLTSARAMQGSMGNINNIDQQQQNYMILDQPSHSNRILTPPDLNYVGLDNDTETSSADIFLNGITAMDNSTVNSMNLGPQPPSPTSNIYSSTNNSCQNYYMNTSQPQGPATDGLLSGDVSTMQKQLPSDDCQYYSLSPSGSSYSYSSPTTSRMIPVSNVMTGNPINSNPGVMTNNLEGQLDTTCAPNQQQLSQVMHSYGNNNLARSNSAVMMQSHPQLVHQHSAGQSTQPGIADYCLSNTTNNGNNNNNNNSNNINNNVNNSSNGSNANNRYNMQMNASSYLNGTGSSNTSGNGQSSVSGYNQSNLQINPQSQQRMIYNDMSSNHQIIQQHDGPINYATSNMQLSATMNVDNQSDRINMMSSMPVLEPHNVGMCTDISAQPVKQSNVMVEQQQQNAQSNCQYVGVSSTLLDSQAGQIGQFDIC